MPPRPFSQQVSVSASLRSSPMPAFSDDGRFSDCGTPFQTPRANRLSRSGGTSDATKVFVRVRPFNYRELHGDVGVEGGEATQLHKYKPVCIVNVDESHPSLITTLDPSKGYAPKDTYVFERCFNSTVATGRTLEDANKTSMTPVEIEISARDQALVYAHVGQPVLNNALEGYNGCVFAYGQTGSGKTFTMMGPPVSLNERVDVGEELYEAMTPIRGSSVSSRTHGKFTARRTRDNCPDGGATTSPPPLGKPPTTPKTNSLTPSKTAPPRPDMEVQGITPRLARELFQELQRKRELDSAHSFRVEVEYYEIYNEKVLDLLNTTQNVELRVRNSAFGPYVENLERRHVCDAEDILKLLRRGNMARHTAATKLNDRSSRSHAILAVCITQMRIADTDAGSRVTSKLHLVDLAGSERTGASGVVGKHFQESTKINLSLTTLGRVIDALADLSLGKQGVFCPYRDSNLTWLLRDSLGGNSKTTMVATISPHAVNFEEACHTLRYASRAKQIMTKAIVNEDPQQRLIKDLTAEVERLQRRLNNEENGDEFLDELRDRVLLLETDLECKQVELNQAESEVMTLRTVLAVRQNASHSPSPSSKDGKKDKEAQLRAEITRLEAENLQMVTMEGDLLKERSKRIQVEQRLTVALRNADAERRMMTATVKRLERERKQLEGDKENLRKVRADLKAAEEREAELLETIKIRKKRQGSTTAVGKAPQLSEEQLTILKELQLLPKSKSRSVGSQRAPATINWAELMDGLIASALQNHQRNTQPPMAPRGVWGTQDCTSRALIQHNLENSFSTRSSRESVQSDNEKQLRKELQLLQAELASARQAAKLDQATPNAQLIEKTNANRRFEMELQRVKEELKAVQHSETLTERRQEDKPQDATHLEEDVRSHDRNRVKESKGRQKTATTSLKATDEEFSRMQRTVEELQRSHAELQRSNIALSKEASETRCLLEYYEGCANGRGKNLNAGLLPLAVENLCIQESAYREKIVKTEASSMELLTGLEEAMLAVVEDRRQIFADHAAKLVEMTQESAKYQALLLKADHAALERNAFLGSLLSFGGQLSILQEAEAAKGFYVIECVKAVVALTMDRWRAAEELHSDAHRIHTASIHRHQAELVSRDALHKQQLAHVSNDLASTRAEEAVLRTTVATLQGDLTAARARELAAKAFEQTVAGQLAELNATHAAVLAGKNAQAKASEERVAMLLSSVGELQSKLQTMEQMLSDRGFSLQVKEAEVAGLSEQIAVLRSGIAELSKKHCHESIAHIAADEALDRATLQKAEGERRAAVRHFTVGIIQATEVSTLKNQLETEVSKGHQKLQEAAARVQVEAKALIQQEETKRAGMQERLDSAEVEFKKVSQEHQALLKSQEEIIISKAATVVSLMEEQSSLRSQLVELERSLSHAIATLTVTREAHDTIKREKEQQETEAKAQQDHLVAQLGKNEESRHQLLVTSHQIHKEHEAAVQALQADLVAAQSLTANVKEHFEVAMVAITAEMNTTNARVAEEISASENQIHRISEVVLAFQQKQAQAVKMFTRVQAELAACQEAANQYCDDLRSATSNSEKLQARVSSLEWDLKEERCVRERQQFSFQAREQATKAQMEAAAMEMLGHMSELKSRLEGRLESRVSQIQRTAEMMISLQRRQSEYAECVTTLQQQLSESRWGHTAIADKLVASEELTTSLRGQVAALKGSLDALTATREEEHVAVSQRECVVSNSFHIASGILHERMILMRTQIEERACGYELRIEKLMTHVVALRERGRVTSERVQDLHEQVAEGEKKCDEANAKLSSSVAVIRDLEQHITSLQDHLHIAKTAHEDEKVLQLQKDEETSQALEGVRTTMEQCVSDMQNKSLAALAVLESNVQALKEQVEAFKQSDAERSQSLSQLVAELTRKEAESTDRLTELQATMAARQQLKEMVEELEASLEEEAVQRARENASHRQEQQKSELAQISAVKATEAKITAMEEAAKEQGRTHAAQLAAVHAKLQTVQAANESSERTIAKIGKELRDSEVACRSLREQLKHSETDAGRLTAELTYVQLQAAKDATTWEGERDQLRQSISDGEKREEALTSHIAELEHGMEEVQQAMAKLPFCIEELQLLYDAHAATLEGKSEEVAQTQTSLKSKEAAFAATELQFQEHLTSSQQRVSQLQSQVDTKANDMHAVQETTVTLPVQYKEHSKPPSIITKLTETVGTLQRRAAITATALKEAQREKMELSHYLASSTKDLEGTRNLVAQQEAAAVHQTEALVSAEQQVVRLTKSKEDLHHRIKSQEADLLAQKQSLLVLQRRLDTVRVAAAAAEARAADNLSQHEKLEGQVRVFAKASQHSMFRLSNVVHEALNAKTRLVSDGYTAMFQAQEETIDGLQKAVSQFSEFQNTCEQLVESHTNFGHFQQRFVKQPSTSESLKMEIESLSGCLAALSEAQHAANHTIQQQEDLIRELRTQYDAATQEHRAVLQKREDCINQLEEELKAARAALDMNDTMQELNKEFNSLHRLGQLEVDSSAGSLNGSFASPTTSGVVNSVKKKNFLSTLLRNQLPGSVAGLLPESLVSALTQRNSCVDPALAPELDLPAPIDGEGRYCSPPNSVHELLNVTGKNPAWRPLHASGKR